MGAFKIVLWSIFGPFLIYLTLLAHVFYQFILVDPLPAKIAGWPEGTDETVKNMFVQNRKYILQVSYCSRIFYLILSLSI